MALYIVGTPIGNLGDISTRASETLSSVDYIACEDTRHTMILLSHLGIKKPLISYYKQKERESSEKIIGLLKGGANVALVSDAGMPCISDPGSILVNSARAEGIQVISVPGPTAVTTAAALAGICGGFVFIGFLPEQKCDKDAKLAPFKNVPIPMAFYAGPHDVERLLAYLYTVFGDRKVWLVREITKIYESVTETTLAQGIEGEARGEYVIFVDGKAENDDYKALSPEEHLAKYLAEGMDKKDAIKKVAAERGVPKDEIYKLTINK